MNAADEHQNSCEVLLRSEITGPGTRDQRDVLVAATAADLTTGFHALLVRLFDLAIDYEYAAGVGEFRGACERAAIRHDVADAEEVLSGGFRLMELNYLLLERRFAGSEATDEAQTIARCRELVASRGTCAAIRMVFAPTDENESRFWEDIDFSSLVFHRAGTTSFILRGLLGPPIDEVGSRRAIALKCVLFPWNGMASVSKATDEYIKAYGGGPARFPGVVPAIASSPSWIVMDFQEGPTLAEYLAGRVFADPIDRVETARNVARLLTRALHRLAVGARFEVLDRGRQHLDLSPSNIILVDDDRELRFIDLGVNHLYSRQLGMAEHDDSVYVAPEVKNRSPDVRLSDVYSLGVILTEILAGTPPRDGRVPSRVWEMSPVLARTLDDLLELDPTKRLVLPTRGNAPADLDALEAELSRVFARALTDRALQARGRGRIWARLTPTSREVANQYSQYKESRRLGRVARFDTYLLFFSVVASACWWFIAAKTALFKLDDVVTGELDELPSGTELAADLIAFSQGLVAAKYYQSILARLTTRGLGVEGWVTEVVVRSMSVVALSTTMLAVFWRPSMWAWSCALGAVLVALANLLTLRIGDRQLRQAHGVLSSAGTDESAAQRGYEQWWWTMLLYAVVIMVIASGLEFGFLEDEGAYVFGLLLITVGIHYIAKLVLAGPAVRGGLAHAFAVGERYRIIRREPHPFRGRVLRAAEVAEVS